LAKCEWPEWLVLTETPNRQPPRSTLHNIQTNFPMKYHASSGVFNSLRNVQAQRYMHDWLSDIHLCGSPLESPRVSSSPYRDSCHSSVSHGMQKRENIAA
jgi:hypothetical protein